MHRIKLHRKRCKHSIKINWFNDSAMACKRSLESNVGYHTPGTGRMALLYKVIISELTNKHVDCRMLSEIPAADRHRLPLALVMKDPAGSGLREDTKKG